MSTKYQDIKNQSINFHNEIQQKHVKNNSSTVSSHLLKPYEYQIIEVANQIDSIEKDLITLENGAHPLDEISMLKKLEVKAEELRDLQRKQAELMREIKERSLTSSSNMTLLR